MRKILFCFLAIAVVKFAGCQSAQKPMPVLPPYYNTISVHEGLYCTESAKVGVAGMHFAKNEAASKARDEMRRLTNVKIKRVIKHFTKTIGVGDEQAVNHLFATASVQVMESIISMPVYSKNEYYDQDNKIIYVFIAFDDEMVAQVAESIKTTVLKTMKEDAALWERFQVKNGMSELEKEVAKEFGDKMVTLFDMSMTS